MAARAGFASARSFAERLPPLGQPRGTVDGLSGTLAQGQLWRPEVAGVPRARPVFWLRRALLLRIL